MKGPSPDEDDGPNSPFAVLLRALGEEMMFALLEECGGVRIKIPARATAKNPIAKVVGLENLSRLVGLWGGEYVTVPLAKRFRVRVLRQRGASYSEIAHSLCMTEVRSTNT